MTLTDEAWEHIASRTDRRITVADVLDAVLVAERHRDPRPSRAARGHEQLFAAGRTEGRGPSKWLVVGVRYVGERGWIRTAFPHRRDPRPGDRL